MSNGTSTTASPSSRTSGNGSVRSSIPSSDEVMGSLIRGMSSVAGSMFFKKQEVFDLFFDKHLDLGILFISLVQYGRQATRGKKRPLSVSDVRATLWGKFRRTCEPKRNSGKIDVPEDIFKLYEAKGSSRNKLFEAFIKTGGDKD